MKQEKYFLVLDVGTSGIKALVFTRSLTVIGRAYKPIGKSLPQKGFVEQDPQELVEVSRLVLKQVVEENNILTKDIVALGIANQRETTILWDKQTGKPVYPAIVWEDDRTQEECLRLQKHEEVIRTLSGLTVLPYFSASKIAWILVHIPHTKKLLQTKRLLFGTVDSWIIWNLSKEKKH
ncbi:MAG: glycerol kinase, partial [Patescibacteria group bacterium]|nr:glycerol kinase [Patescibacteria group bacterium]